MLAGWLCLCKNLVRRIPDWGYDGEIISKGVEEINVLTSEKVFVIVHPDSRVKHYWNARTKTWTPFADSATPLLNQKALDSAPSYGVVEEKLN